MHNTRDKVPQVLQTERRIGLADPDPAFQIDADLYKELDYQKLKLKRWH